MSCTCNARFGIGEHRKDCPDWTGDWQRELAELLHEARKALARGMEVFEASLAVDEDEPALTLRFDQGDAEVVKRFCSSASVINAEQVRVVRAALMRGREAAR